MIKTNYKKLIILGSSFGKRCYYSNYFQHTKSTTKLCKIGPMTTISKKYKVTNTHRIKSKY